MKIVESDPDIYVQKAAVEALGTIGDPRLVELLRTIGDGKNRFLASAARPRA